MAMPRESAPVSPPAVRFRRPGWRDPRLLLGVVLVAVSVASTAWLVDAAGRTSPVWVARQPLVPGQALVPGDLAVRDVRVGDLGERYLAVEGPLPEGLVLSRTVGEGELVPLSALASDAAVDVRPVAVTPATPLSSEVRAGSTVDLWFVPAEAPRGGGGTGGDAVGADSPRELAAGLTVAEVSEPETGFTLGTGVTVHVLVPVETLGAVLEAVGSDGSVEVVHVPGATSSP